MVELTEYEKHLKNKNELVYYWLCNNEISYEQITISYVTKIENEKNYFLNTLSKSDVYVCTLIDNKKKEMDYQRPFAIEYMLNNKRLEGTEWFENLKNKE